MSVTPPGPPPTGPPSGPPRGRPPSGRAPSAAPQSRRPWVLAVGALVAVAALVVVIVVASGGSDDESNESNACATLDGVVTATDVDSILGEPVVEAAPGGDDVNQTCEFLTEDDDVIVSIELFPADSEGLAFSRTLYEEDGVEDLSGVGDDAFYSPGDPENAVPTVVVLKGAVIVNVAYLGDREDVREPLIELATLVVNRLPQDVDG